LLSSNTRLITMKKLLAIGLVLLASTLALRQYPYNIDHSAYTQFPNMENIYEYEHRLFTTEVVVEEEPEIKMVYVDPKERECLAKAIYWEARNQSLDGKIAVGFVVINRVNAGLWHDSVCKVVFQGCQFSWVCTANAKKNPANNKNYDEQVAWAESIALANELLSEYNEIQDVTYGAVFFHAHYVRPDWSKWKKVERTVRIDDHIFYRLRSM